MTSPETDLDDRPEDEQEEKPKLTLEVRVDRPGTCQRHVTVSVSRDDVERYYDDAFTEMMPEASIPGFRPGRAPRKLVEHRFRKEIADRIKGSIVLDSLAQISEEQQFAAISEPDFDFDVIEIPPEGPFTFEFDIEVRPEFTLPAWKGLKLDRPVRDITRQDVDQRLAQLLEDRAALIAQPDPAEPGDVLLANLQFHHDGQRLSELSGVELQLKPTLSFSDAVLNGFDRLMQGAGPGERRETQVTISPDPASEQLAGKLVDVSIEVLEVKRRSLPQLDSNLLAELGDFDSEGELRDAIQRSLERRRDYEQRQRFRRQIAELLTQGADWDLPPDLLRRQSRRELERAVLELQSAGYSREEILAHENRIRQNSLAATRLALKEHFILERIAEDEKIEATEDNLDGEIRRIALQGGDSPRRIRARLEKRGSMDALRNQVVERLVIETILEHAVFRDVAYQPAEAEAATQAIDHVISGPREADIPVAKHGGEAQPLPESVDHK